VSLRKIVPDSNVYIGWLNDGLHERVMIGPGLVRFLSAVVLMERRVGATTLPARRAVDLSPRPVARGNTVDRRHQPWRDAPRRRRPEPGN
jgi:hypothetical protein